MKKVFKNLDKPLLLITILLFVVGLIAVFSSSNVTAYMSHAVSPYNYFLKQLFFLITGLILFFIMIKMSTKTYGKLSWGLLLIVIASLVCLLVLGRAKNQAISWFDLGFISIQPSEFAKVISIIWLARYYDLNSKGLKTYMKSLFPIGICMIICLLIFIQPDLGTTIIYTSIIGAMFFSSPVSKSIKFKLLFLGVGLLVFAALGYKTLGSKVLQDRQNERFNYRNPCKRLLSTGNQVCNGYIAINNGGLTGVGLGNSTQKYLYLPEPYTDFIFAIIVEEMGVWFGIAILLAYMFLLYRILAIGRKSKSNSGAMMCYGIAIYIFLHIAINLLGLFGLIPMTGVPLPFMSYGGSFTICLIAALTVVQRVSVESGLSRETKRRKRRT
ncbi:MAG: FtsW/RodA/SpoVE family cell cycle protein [Bacilli bacterium]|nr:FtsW/RodA/SpoVE family cell cycle protein [Bacilli bacterium]MBR3049246.1 FtsW/RodA/SpoVE family cell cycle protein [Bacilli bacterium]